ncbi:SicP binding domain protein [Shewanella baltica]|uniref:type III secretion system effector BopA family protein n=1 Tax=Shewanella baltica TaxID=62322 RepID=UPI00217DE424|nr:type III secretion system effector BopA family protein [Shewanella baltica]MCS6237289.1 SicP binding domain protein [Shewanella baltica]MCS6271787.1 SicP binding domain protein [Shewanella baltica]
MALDINAFSHAAKLDGRLTLVDTSEGIPTIIAAKEGFKEKLLSMLSHIPLLKNTQAVQDYVNGLSLDNKQVLGVFLQALAARFGHDAALDIVDAVDLSGHTPLTLRTIEQLTERSEAFAPLHLPLDICETDEDALKLLVLPSPIAIESESSEKQTPSPSELKPLTDPIAVYKGIRGTASHTLNQQFIAPQVFLHEQDQCLKQLLTTPIPQKITMPTTQTWLASWVYSEPEPIKTLQQAIKNYNQVLSDTQLATCIQNLNQSRDPLITSDELTAQRELVTTALAKVKQALTLVAELNANLSVEQSGVLSPLLAEVNLGLSQYEVLTAAMQTYEQALLASNPVRQALSEFHAALPYALQNKLTADTLVSSYQLFSPLMQTELGQTERVEYLAASLVSMLNEENISAVSEQKKMMPEVKSLVLLIKQFVLEPMQEPLAISSSFQTPFEAQQAEAEQYLTQIEQAQTLLADCLARASKLSGEALITVGKQVQLEEHLAAVKQAGAQLGTVLYKAINPAEEEVQVDDLTATLLYLGGQEYVEKGSRLQFDEPVHFDDLALELTLRNELDGSTFAPQVASLAQQVLQTQHHLNWFEGVSSISFSPNNPQDISLFDDVNNLRLVSQIEQDQTRYHSFLTERLSLCNDYHRAVTELLLAVPSEAVRNQLSQELVHINADQDATRTLVERLNRLQSAQDVLVIAGNNVAKLSALTQQLEHVRRETNAERAAVNQSYFLSYLPELKNNNEQVRALTQEQHLLSAKLDKLTEHLQQLYGDGLVQTLAEPEASSPELRAFRTVTSQLAEVNRSLEELDDAYQHGLLQLKKATIAAKNNGGFPEQGGMASSHAWQSWLVQKFVGNWSSQYRPSLEELILSRQLAKNNMSSVAEAYLALASSVKASKTSLVNVSVLTSPKVMVAALGDLHNWSIAHPIEARELAGNLTQAYNIILANPGTFGQELVNTVTTVWQTGTVQNQVHDILQGKREELPDKTNFAMTPQMIALLHMAQLAPYIAGGAKGAANTGIGGPLVSGVFGMMFPSAGIATPVVGLVGGILQTWSERQLANNMREYRSSEVMVNALIKGMQAEGGLSARGEAIAGYMLQRQALQDVGTVARDCFEVGKVGAVKRAFTDIANWWKHASTGAKALAVVMTVVAASVVSVGAIAAAVFTLGTGGVGIVAAVVLGLGGLMAGAYSSKAVVSTLQGANFLGMADTARAAEAEMTEKRIEQAFAQLAHTPVSQTSVIKTTALSASGTQEIPKSMADVLGLEQHQAVLKAHFLPQLVGLDSDAQQAIFVQGMRQYANDKSHEIEINQAIDRDKTVERAMKWVAELDIMPAQLQQCIAEIDAALLTEISSR